MRLCWQRQRQPHWIPGGRPLHSAGHRWLSALCLLAGSLLLLPGSARSYAQGETSYKAAESQEIRQSAEKILTSPEFRYFKRLEQGSNPFGSGGSGSGMPGGGGTPGGSGAGGSGSGGDSSQSPGGRGSGGDSSAGSSPSSGGSTSTSQSQSSSMPSLAIPAAVSVLMRLFAWLLLLVVAGVIIFLIVMAVKNYDGGNTTTELTGNINLQGEIEPESPPGELSVDVYLSEARKLAAAGQYREAIAQLLLGAMSYAERSGLIRYRRGLTQRDYLRTLRSEKTQFDAMRTMVKVYEPLGFGRRDPAKEHFEQSVAGYEQAFGGEMVDSSQQTV